MRKKTGISPWQKRISPGCVSWILSISRAGGRIPLGRLERYQIDRITATCHMFSLGTHSPVFYHVTFPVRWNILLIAAIVTCDAISLLIVSFVHSEANDGFILLFELFWHKYFRKSRRYSQSHSHIRLPIGYNLTNPRRWEGGKIF